MTRHAHVARNAAPVMTAPTLSRTCSCGNHTTGGTCASCAAEQKKRRVSRYASAPAAEAARGRAASTEVVPPIVHDTLAAPGQRLPRDLRAFMEPRFGVDFSNVRVHTGDTAERSSRAVGADAYAVGPHLVFGAGQYEPGSAAGRRLIAHELTHVMQQRHSGASSRPDAISDPADASEREAEATAKRVLPDSSAAGAATDGTTSAAAPSTLHRQAAQGQQSPQAQQAQGTRTPRRGREPIPNPGGANHFDAVLDRDRSLLEITMRVAFNFVNVPGPMNEPWTPETQATWKREFVRFTTARWTDQFVLVPDGPCPVESVSSVRVLVSVVPDQTPPHFNVTVDNEEMQARSGVRRADREGHFHRLDIERHFLTDAGTNQRVVEHEFGHMLGIAHIRCAGNQPECYGLTPEAPRSEREDVMGTGEKVSIRDYQVFADVMRQATGCRWKPEERSYLAEILIAIGAVAAVGAGLGIAAAFGAFS